VFAFVNRDWMAYAGRMAGRSYKLAKVALMRFHPADTVYDGPREGIRISFDVETVGLAMRGYIDLQRPLAAPGIPRIVDGDGSRPMLLGRRFNWDKVADRPLVDDLLGANISEQLVGAVWEGAPSLTFCAAEGDDLLPFTPASMIGGWWHASSLAGATTQYESVHSFNEQ
jgi:hypothetical protein